ncbi:MAG: sigma-70 family RNA polymerase sigma factor [Candidatus Brocadiales bacterium]
MQESHLDRKKVFIELLSHHHDSLYRFCLHVIWDKNSAEDVLQEAILSAYRNFGHFQPGTNFKAWMFSFLINKIFDSNKRFKKEFQQANSSQGLDIVEHLEKEEAYISILENPSVFFERMDARIKGALLSLKPTERMVFLLRAVEGFTYKEIAQFLDLPLGTVMSHLFRSRARLRELLADYAREMGFVR